MSSEQWFAYVLLCQNGALYRGYTNDIEKRFVKHREGKGAKYTRMNKPIKVVYFERFDNKLDAIKRERYLKSKEGKLWLKQNVVFEG